MSFKDALESHTPLQTRKQTSLEKLKEIRKAFSSDRFFKSNKNVCVFSAGSFGRLDSGNKSDLDIFVTTASTDIGRLKEIELFASILSINKTLDFPDLSNDGQFLKVFNISKSKNRIGSPSDDTENWFTARMLLILESNYLANEASYNKHCNIATEVYFRDATSAHGAFKPLFLLNDILRFWRTLCLNYEEARHDSERSWKKRNFNLKFSRMLSVFSTVLPLILEDEMGLSKFNELMKLSPMDRLVKGLDMLSPVNSKSLKEDFVPFLNCYESFLATKEGITFDELTDTHREQLNKDATFFSTFLYRALTNPTVRDEYKKFLII